MSRFKIDEAFLLDDAGEPGARRPVAFARRGVSVSRSLSVSWQQLTGLEIRAAPPGAARLGFHVGARQTELLLPGRAVPELRRELMDWVTATAREKIRINLSWDLLAGMTTAESVAAQLRAKPMTTERALGLIATSQKDRESGDLTRAQAILEAVIMLSTPALGATAAPTVAARNNLGWILGASGDRRGAVQIYWALLDDATDAEIARKRPGSDDFTSLVKVRTNALRNLAMLHNPRWRP